jgi:hypothetical protein
MPTNELMGWQKSQRIWQKRYRGNRNSKAKAPFQNLSTISPRYNMASPDQRVSQ